MTTNEAKTDAVPGMSGAALIAQLSLDSEYITVDDVAQGFADLEEVLRARRDRRAIFVTAYLCITLEIKRRLDAHLFLDNPWVARYVAAFANLYRRALLAYEQGDRGAVPKAWLLAFDAAVNSTGLVVQDLVLGINAHINHDLPLALTQVSIDPDRAKCYQDHTAVNDALKAATNPVEDRVSRMYAPVLSALDVPVESLVENLTMFSFVNARESAWVSAVSLANAHSDQEREAIRKHIDHEAGVLAQLILGLTTMQPALLAGLQQLEKTVPWWSYVTLSDVGSAKPAPVADEPLAVNNFDELIGRLQEIIQRYDARRSKMSIYPSMYLMFTHKVKALIASGALFDNGNWIMQLDLHFATQYLHALEAFEAGRLEAMPTCWATTFQATDRDEVIIVQALFLAVNARLNHDLPIALLRAGLDVEDAERLDAQRRDLERMHTIFQAEIKPVLELLAQKYSHVLGVVNFVAGAVEEAVADFSYTRARDAAWENAVALSRATSEEMRQSMVRQMDQKTTALAQTILLRKVLGASWAIKALQQVENEFPGSWSEWIQSPAATADKSGR